MDKNVKINTEYIKLVQLLKFSGAAAVGSDANALIADGKVMVNGQICTMRGKKIRAGDCVVIDGISVSVSADGHQP